MYRLIINPAIEEGEEVLIKEFETFKEVKAAEEVAAELLLFLQDTLYVMPYYSNTTLVEEKLEGEWRNVDLED